MSKINKKRREAQDLIKKGKLSKAIELYRKIISRQANNPNLHNELGDIYFRAGDRVQAVSSFENAIENYEKMGLYNNAVAVCKKVLRIFPDRLITIYELGELKAKQGFGSDAAEHFSHYLNMLVSNSNMPPDGVEERLELILEYMKGKFEVLDLVVDAFVSLEMNMKAAEVLVSILNDACGSGSGAVGGNCRERLERLMQSLTPDQKSKIDEQLSSADGPDPGATGDRMDMEDVVSEKVVGTEDIISGSEYIDEEESDSPETHSGGDNTAGPETGDSQYDMDDPETGDSPATGSERVEEEVFPPPELDEEEVAAGDHSSGTDETQSFAELIDSVSDESGESLAGQITSDIDDGDLKSHYDMGMAYIEMQLYDKAIKELQIASRADEMKLRSLEMIGLCFISKQEPRLAVKQLERGLEISEKLGAENLGIHYNLGLAYEALDETEKAREHFEQVYIVDVTFREIKEKMQKFKTLT